MLETQDDSLKKKKLRIVMVGPVYPFKTGLSYYNSLLYFQLKKHHSVQMISYTMQYPQILYRKPQKDYKDDILRVDDAEFLLNTANPISWLKTAKYINKINPELVIFQWLHPYFSFCYSFICKFLKSPKILFICHNIFPHERFPMDKALVKVALKQGDLFITHSKSDAENLKSVVSDVKMEITVHPTYSFFRQGQYSPEGAREDLNIANDTKVLLFFGLVREYKGLKYLLQTMRLIKEDHHWDSKSIKLVIAGDFGGKKEQYNRQINENDIAEYISIYDAHIPVPEVEKFFVAADLVILPYVSATQSGVIQVAYSFNKPVIATRVGGLSDVVINGKTGYLVESANPAAIYKAIRDYFDNDREDLFKEGIESEKYKYSWERMEDIILKLYD